MAKKNAALEKKSPFMCASGRVDLFEGETFESRRKRVMDILNEDDTALRAVYADDRSDAQFVLVAVAIRGVGSCELAIPRSKYDAWKIIEILDKSHPVARAKSPHSNLSDLSCASR